MAAKAAFDVVCRLGLDRLSTSTMNHLRKLGLASFFFFGLGVVSGAISPSTIGWTPQTAITIALICYCIGLVLALIAFMQSRRGQNLDGNNEISRSRPARARHYRRVDLFSSGHDRLVGRRGQSFSPNP